MSESRLVGNPSEPTRRISGKAPRDSRHHGTAASDLSNVGEPALRRSARLTRTWRDPNTSFPRSCRAGLEQRSALERADYVHNAAGTYVRETSPLAAPQGWGCRE